MIIVKTIHEEEANLLAKGDVTLPFQGLEPEGRMLVDSDGAAFVYLLAHGDEFIHLRFEESAWQQLHTYRASAKPMFVQTVLKPVELTAFWEELDFLLDNIKGNQNYGKEFVDKADEIFELNSGED
ncbi:hypothetical protein ACFO4L_02010 [Bacillus daqingensis]|uniref:Uncharacterized protein n=1 Tax=Bacillus daqingensis TaxID=872396 RepID=A0ABV9NTQ9_9BACI